MRPFTADSKSVTSFGSGRDKYNKVVSTNGTNYMPYDPMAPGPGFYNNETYLTNEKEQKHKYGIPNYNKPESKLKLTKITIVTF